MTTVANAMKGRFIEKVADGADLILVLFKTIEADAVLKDYDTLAALDAAAGNVECDFTNYARKVIANADVTITVDDTADEAQLALDNDQVYAAAGGATNNTVVKGVICTDGATDADRVVGTLHDLNITTDGNQFTITDPANGFYAAA